MCVCFVFVCWFVESVCVLVLINCKRARTRTLQMIWHQLWLCVAVFVCVSAAAAALLLLYSQSKTKAAVVPPTSSFHSFCTFFFSSLCDDVNASVFLFLLVMNILIYFLSHCFCFVSANCFSLLCFFRCVSKNQINI